MPPKFPEEQQVICLAIFKHGLDWSLPPYISIYSDQVAALQSWHPSLNRVQQSGLLRTSKWGPHRQPKCLGMICEEKLPPQSRWSHSPCFSRWAISIFRNAEFGWTKLGRVTSSDSIGCGSSTCKALLGELESFCGRWFQHLGFSWGYVRIIHFNRTFHWSPLFWGTSMTMETFIFWYIEVQKLHSHRICLWILCWGVEWHSESMVEGCGWGPRARFAADQHPDPSPIPIEKSPPLGYR